jgi:hypothetical protein
MKTSTTDSTSEVQDIITVTDATNAGATCWWRLSGEVSRAALATTWAAASLDEDLLPAGATPGAALRRALRDFQKARQLVRPLDQDLTFAIVREDVVDKRPVNAVLLNVEMGKDDELVIADPEGYAGHAPLAEALRAAYAHALTTYDTNDVSNWMANQLLPRVNAVSLRDRGGFYFIPATTIDQWRTMVRAVRSVSSHKVYELPAMACDEAVDAVLDAVTREAEAEAVKMEDRLINEDLSPRALRNQVAKLDKLAGKLTSYEDLLGGHMTTLQARLEALNAQMAAAIFTAEAKQDDADGVTEAA